MPKIFDLERIDAIKVQFKQGIFEDDFPDRGMKAWLTKIEKSVDDGCYKLYFDFSEFEEDNDKYFTEVYYPNIHTPKDGRKLFTAKEAGYYSPKYSVWFGDTSHTDEQNESNLNEYLRIVEE